MKQQPLFAQLDPQPTEPATPLYQDVVQNYALQIRRMQRNNIINEKRQAILDKMREEDQKQQVQETIAQFHKDDPSGQSGNPDETDNRYQQFVILDEAFRQEIEAAMQIPVIPQQLKSLVELIFSLDIISKHQGVIGVRRMLERYPTMIQQIVDEGVIPKMIEFIKDKHHPHLQLEALSLLTNICGGTAYHCQMVVKRGGVGLFIDLLASSKRQIVDQAIWALGNIGCEIFRDVIVREQGIPALVSAIQNTPYFKTKHLGCWAINCICLKKKPLTGSVTKPAIKLLSNVIATSSDLQEIIESEMLWVIAVCMEESDIETVSSSGILFKLIRNLLNIKSLVLTPTLKILSRMTCGPKQHVQRLLKEEIISHLYFLLCHASEQIIKQVCFILTNMVINYNQLADQFLELQQVPLKVVDLLEIGSDKVAVEAINFIAALQRASDPNKVLQFYMQNNILESFFETLDKSNFEETKFSALRGITKVLQIGQRANTEDIQKPIQYVKQQPELISLLQRLQYHKSPKIYNAINVLVHTFFQLEDPLNL